jgi:lipoprotein-anchoring transpeptidase ErfK/SrfK
LAIGLWCLAAQPAHAQGATYVVRPGDTLAAIAQRHGTDVATLSRLNQLGNANIIRSGQSLELPLSALRTDTPIFNDASVALLPNEHATRVYVVQPGDSLVSVANEFHTTPARIAELNRRAATVALRAGEPLRVPVVSQLEFSADRSASIPTPGSYFVHVVQQGESLAGIADAYDTTLRQLLDVNDIDSGTVKPGLRVLVPPTSYAELFSGTEMGPDDYPLYPAVPTQGKWISVDLSHQRAYAWEGNKLLKRFVISSGKARTPTVTGVFRIWAKVSSQTMSGGSYATGDYYNLPGVRWVQYFYRDYALHGAYWHNRFGTPTSHGCVNLTNTDAEWLYDWTSPTIEENGWHILDDSMAPGTLVIVHS